jgi:uracil-DNA glycosylase
MLREVGRARDRAAPLVRARPRPPLALPAQALLLRLRAPALDARDGAAPRLRHARADDRRARARGRRPAEDFRILTVPEIRAASAEAPLRLQGRAVVQSAFSIGRGSLSSSSQHSAGEFDALVAEAAACRRCAAMCGRSAVLSEQNGRVGARVMFVGEAPGRQGGDRTRVPFSGDQSGRNFSRYLASIGLTREEVFITNAALCNPRTRDGREPQADARGGLELLGVSASADRDRRPARRRHARGGVACRPQAVEYHPLTLKENVGEIHAWGGRLLVPLYHPSPQVLASHRREPRSSRITSRSRAPSAILAARARPLHLEEVQKSHVKQNNPRSSRPPSRARALVFRCVRVRRAGAYGEQPGRPLRTRRRRRARLLRRSPAPRRRSGEAAPDFKLPYATQEKPYT